MFEIRSHARTICFASVALAATLAAGPARAGDPASKPFTVTVDKATPVHGQPATVHVVVRPAAGYHVNVDYPTSLKLARTDGVDLAKERYTKADGQLTTAEARFDVTLTPREAGKKTVNGVVSFAVCTDTNCNPQRTPVAIEVDAK